MSGDRQENAMWPWQSKRKPDGCNCERSKRDGEPNQFVIKFAWSKRPMAEAHC